MTINLADNSPRISYSVASGVTQSSFTIPFEFFSEGSINVYVDGALKTINTDYTVSGGSGSTGSISMSVTGASGGSTVVITRSVVLERTSDFPTSGPFQIDALNTELDRLVAIAADLQDGIDRSLKLTDYDADASLALPDVDTRKGATLAFNEVTGAVDVGPSIADVQTVSDASADIQTLAQIEDGTEATDAIKNVAGIASDVTAANENITEIQQASTNAATATTKAAEATASASAASTSETNAATSETNAGTSETNSAASAAAAATSETNSAASASNALTSENNAGSSATAAAASQVAAANSAAAAAASYDSFDDRYLGSKSSDPTVNNDGDPLIAGNLYFNSSDGEMRVYDGAVWIAATSAGGVSLLQYKYTATAGQTTFSGADDNAATLSYVQQNLIVTLNGIVLEDAADYTASNGTSVVLTSAAAAGDEMNIVAFKSFTTADMVPASTGGTFSGNIAVPGLTVSGQSNTSDILPVSDAASAIGSASKRYSDLYLSGGVYLGGTGSANLLDDYEEGTWDVTVATEGGTSYTLGSYVCRYIKVGDLVHIEAYIPFTAEGSGTVTVISLPFVPKDTLEIFQGYIQSGVNHKSAKFIHYSGATVLVSYADGTSYQNYWMPKTQWAPNDIFRFAGSYHV